MSGATIAFAGSTYPTANVFYPYIVNVKIVLTEAHNSKDTYLMSMADAMLGKFDKYWEEKNNLMVIATILDPRFKMRYITWCFGEIYHPCRCINELDEINKELEMLYKKYNKLLVDSGNDKAQCSAQVQGTQLTHWLVSSSLLSVCMGTSIRIATARPSLRGF